MVPTNFSLDMRGFLLSKHGIADPRIAGVRVSGVAANDKKVLKTFLQQRFQVKKTLY